MRSGTFASLIHAFDAINARNAPNVDEDGLKLALVGDFQAGFDAGVKLVWAAFKIADIGAGSR